MNQYIRAGTYKPEHIFPYIGNHLKKFEGKPVSMNSKRYKVFKKSLQCVSCGIKGKFFALEHHKKQRKSTNKFHFNLYAIKDGEEILMTKDHIIPKSKGGSDSLKNLQTMCCECNSKKGDLID